MSNPLVVIVEDDRAVRDVLAELLRSEGYAVKAIGDGPSAFQRIQRIGDNAGPIAAITLDLSLPGKDGATILQELKANPRMRHVPVVVISASVQMLPPAARPLAAAVIRKPFDVMHLLDTIAQVVGDHAPASSGLPSTAVANRLAKS